MNLIKGFVTINTYVSNVKNTVAPLGELSTWSQTYSRQKADYALPTYGNLKLTTFKSVNSISKAYYTLTNTQVEEVFDVVNKCIEYNTTHIQPHSPDDFRNNITNAFYGKLLNFNIGSFVSNGDVSLPQWVSWGSVDNNNDSIKIWLSDMAFKEQYDEYEIEVIPPVTDLSLFFGMPNLLTTAISSRSVSQTYELIDQVKAGNPETCVRSLPFTCVNLFITSAIHSDWTVVIYGKAGDQLDNIKEAITNYLTTTTTKSLEQWQDVLPELFERTEFVLVPLWNKKSIRNLTNLSSLYSSIISYKETLNFLNGVYYGTGYPDGYMADNVAIMSYDYKGISIAVIPGTTNMIDKRKLTDLFPDYIPVSTSSLDFSRMSIKTQQFVVELGKLLLAAETAVNIYSMPGNFRQISRNGVAYITTTFNEVNYLVAAGDSGIYA
jgi:hypothetical protein